MIESLTKKEKFYNERMDSLEIKKNNTLNMINNNYNEYKNNFGLNNDKNSKFNLCNFFKKVSEEENDIKKTLDELEKKCQENIYETIKENEDNINLDGNIDNIINKNEFLNKKIKRNENDYKNKELNQEKSISFNIIKNNKKQINNIINEIYSQNNIFEKANENIIMNRDNKPPNNINNLNIKNNNNIFDNKVEMLMNQISNINKIGYFNKPPPSIFDTFHFSTNIIQKSEILNLKKFPLTNIIQNNSFLGFNNLINELNLNKDENTNNLLPFNNKNKSTFLNDNIIKFSNFNNNKNLNSELKKIKIDLFEKKLGLEEKQKYLFSMYKPNKIPNDLAHPTSEILKVICYFIENDELTLIDIKFELNNNKNEFPERFYKIINLNNSLYVLGGENSLGEELDCTWKLELDVDCKDNIIITAKNIAKLKEKRKNHNSIYIPKYRSILVCGGENNLTTEYLKMDNIKDKYEWKDINIKLRNPIKEGCLFIINETKVVLIGGYNTKSGMYNQRCELLDLEKVFENKYLIINESFSLWEEIELEQNINIFMKSYMGIITNIYKDKITIFGGDIIHNGSKKNEENDFNEIHKLKNCFYNLDNNKFIVNTQEIKGIDRLSHLLFSDCQTFIDLYGKNKEHFKVAFTNQNKLVKFNCSKGGFSFKHFKNNNIIQ